MTDMSKYFCGTVSTHKFSQVIHLEMIPVGYSVDGVFHPTGYQRNLYTATFVEKRYLFEGVPVSVAESLSGSVTVTDINGATHTVSFDSKVTDGSSGTAVFEKVNNSVSITKFSPHLRCVEVVYRTGTLYRNDDAIA